MKSEKRGWWLLSINEMLADFPTTNARVFITLLGFIVTGTVYLYLLLIGADAGIDESVFGMWLTFLSVWAGVDVYWFNTKRKSFIPVETKSEIE